MPYVDLAGLSRYASRQKERLERDCALLRDMQWTRSEKAGAVSLWPVGGTQLKPSVDFLFSETPPAEGDKGPENPSTITGVSSVKVTRCGKNLLNVAGKSSYTGEKYSYTTSQDGSITITTAAASRDTNSYISLADNLYLPAGEDLYLSVKEGRSNSFNGLALQLVALKADGSQGEIVWQRLQNSTTAITIPKYAKYGIRIYIASNYDATSGVTLTPMAQFVSQDAEWELFVGYNLYTISLGSTYYGGTLDVASGVMTVIVYGEQIPSFSYVYNEYSNTVAFRTLLSYPTAKIADNYYGVSDKFEFSGSNTDAEHWRLEGGGDGNRCLFFINKSRLDLSGAVDPSAPTGSEWVDAANAWLADNPVFLVYGVATPTTVQLSPASISALAQPDKYTPRLNTLYTDAQAVQVGYVKSPIRDEYELQQAVIAQGGNV